MKWWDPLVSAAYCGHSSWNPDYNSLSILFLDVFKFLDSTILLGNPFHISIILLLRKFHRWAISLNCLHRSSSQLHLVGRKPVCPLQSLLELMNSHSHWIISLRIRQTLSECRSNILHRSSYEEILLNLANGILIDLLLHLLSGLNITF